MSCGVIELGPQDRYSRAVPYRDRDDIQVKNFEQTRTHCDDSNVVRLIFRFAEIFLISIYFSKIMF